MPTKKYSFVKILGDYNKEFNCSYVMSRDVTNISIQHIIETNTYYVLYTDEDNCDDRRDLGDFIHHYISEDIVVEDV